MPRILIVDDQRNMRTSLGLMLRGASYDVEEAESGERACEVIDEEAFDLVLTDLKMKETDGLDVLRHVRENAPLTEVIVMTGYGTVETAVEAMRMGAFDYLQKPFTEPQLMEKVGQAMERRWLKTDLDISDEALRERFDFSYIIGQSIPMRRALTRVAKIAPTDTTVLLVGASGTGKEVVAETIHRLSRRSDGDFVPINCSAVSPQLIESELFGHEKGSFTGADRRHLGVFERAHRGSLLLDEITEMSEELQVKLLRVLEGGAVRRVGGDREIEVDVRVIAATNRDPEEAVTDGKLRNDLFYRLNVFPIRLPELNQRGEDVKLLAVHFLGQLSRAAGVAKQFDSKALDALVRYHWPGNVRELRNVVERAFILASDMVTVDCLPPELGDGITVRSAGLQAPVGTPLDEVMKAHTLATLEHLGGNKRRAADALGISLKTLYNRLKRYQSEDDTGGR